MSPQDKRRRTIERRAEARYRLRRAAALARKAGLRVAEIEAIAFVAAQEASRLKR